MPIESCPLKLSRWERVTLTSVVVVVPTALLLGLLIAAADERAPWWALCCALAACAGWGWCLAVLPSNRLKEAHAAGYADGVRESSRQKTKKEGALRDARDLSLLLYLALLPHVQTLPQAVLETLDSDGFRQRAREALRRGNVLGERLDGGDREVLTNLARERWVDHCGVQGPDKSVGEA